MPKSGIPRMPGLPLGGKPKQATPSKSTAINSRIRRAPAVPLDRVRLRDLMNHDGSGEKSRMVTLRLPQNVASDVRRVAQRYGSTYAETVIALLNEGLDAARKRRLL